MDLFSDSLARLKHYLRVSKDQEVAVALGLSKTAFSERKKRNSFPEKELRALAQQRPELGIDVDYVMTGVPAGLRHDPAAGLNAARKSGDLHLGGGADAGLQAGLREMAAQEQRSAAETQAAVGSPSVDWSAYLQVPYYDVHASAGNGAVVHEENVVDHLVFKRDWVVRGMGLDPKALALIDVRGDSMSPNINDGDLILLDTRPQARMTEGIYAINLDGGLLVKRLRLRLSGAIDVISDNERYGTETISGDQLAQLHIVGRVVWQGRRV